MVKISLFATNPQNTNRLKNMYRSLKKNNIKVGVVLPALKTRKLGRILSAFFRYFNFSIQEIISNADIIHVFNFPDFAHVGILLKRNKKIIYDLRTPYALFIKYMPGISKFSYLAHLIETKLIQKADLVLAANRYFVEYARKKGAKKVVLLPNYPHTSFKPRYSKVEWKKRNDLPLNKKILLFSGDLSKFEGKFIFKLMKSEFPDLILLALGYNSIDLKKKIPKTLSDRIFVYELRPYKEMPDWINISDVCLATIMKNRGLVSNDEDIWKISEYAALKKPIIVSGLMPSKAYHLIDMNEVDLKNALQEAFKGSFKDTKPKYWESECEPQLIENYKELIKKIKK
ncbi:MAG: glycosyltransferase [Promethearchaeota archaeon]